jgi:hypothetical protein
MPDYLVGFRDSDRRVKYYLGMNGQRGKPIYGPKKDAPRVSKELGETILRQLPSFDGAADFQLVEAKDRCEFK